VRQAPSTARPFPVAFAQHFVFPPAFLLVRLELASRALALREGHAGAAARNAKAADSDSASSASEPSSCALLCRCLVWEAAWLTLQSVALASFLSVPFLRRGVRDHHVAHARRTGVRLLLNAGAIRLSTDLFG